MIGIKSFPYRLSLKERIGKLPPYILLMLISLPALTWRLATYPAIWFDEGYKMNAAHTLAARGIYGTYTIEGALPFDPGISSGPTDIIPLALSFKLFGPGIVQARLVICLFTLLALLTLYKVAVYLYGQSAGLFIPLVILALPPIQGVSFLLIGRQVLSEAPALAMVMLGFWLWFRSWENRSLQWAGFAGLALGLGLLSKTQTAIALVPAIGLITLGRGLKDRSLLLQLIIPPIVLLAIVGGWMMVGSLVVPALIRQENSILLKDAIRSNLLTGLWGRHLSPRALVIFIIMLIGSLSGLWRALRSTQTRPAARNLRWAEASIALFALGSALWFAFLSVGWPRYAYAGLIASLLLVGKLVWDGLQQVRGWVGRYWPQAEARFYLLALTTLIIWVLFINVYRPLQLEMPPHAQETADYIRTQIPRQAVIESWEWELDALSSHWNYHHPNQRYLFLAIRQFSQEQKPFDLDYDVLQADPDYLITGPFSDWTHLYEMSSIQSNFRELARFGVYRIYQRVRR